MKAKSDLVHINRHIIILQVDVFELI